MLNINKPKNADFPFAEDDREKRLQVFAARWDENLLYKSEN